MQFDQNALNELLRLDNEALWKTVLTIASLRGISLPQTPPPAEEFAKLRGLLSGAGSGKPDVAQALKILDDYRKNGQ